MALCKGLQAGATARLTKGLQGAYGVAVSSAPIYPATGLLQLLEPTGVNLPTGWTATTGPNCTVGGGTATNTANGVTLASGWLTHTAVVLPASTPFTVAVAIYRPASAPNHAIWCGNSSGGYRPWMGQIFATDQCYISGDTTGYVDFPVTATGGVLIRLRRDSFGIWWAAWTGQADFQINGAIPFNEALSVTNIGAISGLSLYSADNTGFKARAMSSTDLVTDGTWADAAAWFLAKTGLAL